MEKMSLSINGTSKYILEESRLASFIDRWPHSDESICSKKNMAEAGFYYNGQNDEVKCFVCGLKLNDWQPEADDPWQKHQELTKDCVFAKIGKSESHMTVDQLCDVLLGRTLNAIDNCFAKVIDETSNQKS